MSDPVELLTAALVERYRIERELGAGGMATVYLAEDLKLHRKVAVKVLRPELAAALGPERFLREIEIAAKLHHPHILALHDSGEAGGFLYYVMPYVEGESLRDRLNREKQLPVEDALQIAREVADALGSAHRHDVIHRDIKPENILLEEGHAVVADFGIARAIDRAGGDRITETGISLGTPHYMSPEQASGSQDLDGRSDLYSLGCMLYEMLGGEPPFTGPTVESIVHQHLAVEPRPVTALRPAAPDPVAVTVSRVLAKAPADRYASAAAFAQALEWVPDQRPPVASGNRRPRVVVSLVTAVIVVVLAGLGWNRFVVPGSAGSPVATNGRANWLIVAELEGGADAPTRAAARSLVSGVFDQSAALSVVPPSQLVLGLEYAGKPDTTRVDVAVARELALRRSIPTVVTGQLDRIGTAYAITLRVIDADDGSPRITKTAEVAGEDELIESLRHVSEDLLVSLERQRDLLAPEGREIIAITPSIEAYRRFVLAEERYGRGDYLGVIETLREAIGYDPEFAWGWRALAVLGNNVTGERVAALRQAQQFPERLTQSQRHALEGDVARFVHRDWAAAVRAYDRALELDPGDPSVHNQRQASLSLLGKFVEALAAYDQADSVLPFGLSGTMRANRAVALITMGRLEEARQAIGTVDEVRRPLFEALIAVSERDWDEVERIASPRIDDVALPAFRQSRARLALASADAARGRIGAAVAGLDHRRPSTSEYRPLLSGILQALDPPHDTVSASDQPFVAGAAPYEDAWLAAHGDDWGRVVSMVREVGLGVPGNPYPRWLLAEAFAHTSSPDSAIAYFAMLVDPTFSEWAFLLGQGVAYSFAHRRLGQLYSELDKIDRAEEHWLTFLETFTDPDPDFTWMVTEAQEQLARLGRGR